MSSRAPASPPNPSALDAAMLDALRGCLGHDGVVLDRGGRGLRAGTKLAAEREAAADPQDCLNPGALGLRLPDAAAYTPGRDAPGHARG